MAQSERTERFMEAEEAESAVGSAQDWKEGPLPVSTGLIND